MERILIKMKEIENLFMKNDIILLGEIHGTKEIPLFLLKILKDFYKKNKFTVFLEIPFEYEDNIKTYFEEEKKNGGLSSLEYLSLINELKNIGVRVFFIDGYAKNQQEKEDIIAKNVLNRKEKNTKSMVLSLLTELYFKLPKCIHITSFCVNGLNSVCFHTNWFFNVLILNIIHRKNTKRST